MFAILAKSPDALHHVRCGPEGQFAASQWPRFSSTPAVHVHGWYCWFLTPRGVPFRGWQAQMLGIMDGMELKDFSVVTLPKTADYPQLQLIFNVICIPVLAQRLLHMVHAVLRTIETPQLHGRCSCYACRAGSRRHLPCRGAKADPHDQAVQQILALLCGSCRFSGARCEETVVLPQLHSEKSLWSRVSSWTR